MLNFKQLTLITISFIFSSQAFAQEPQSTTVPVDVPQHAPSVTTEPAKPAEQPVHATTPVEPEKTAPQPAVTAIAPEAKPVKSAVPAKKSKPQHKKKVSSKNQLKVVEEWDRDYESSQFVTSCDEEQTLGYLSNSDEVYVPAEPTVYETGSTNPMTQEAPDLIHIDQDPYSFPLLNKIHEWHRSQLDKPSSFILVFAEGDNELNAENRNSMANVLREIISRPGAIVRIKSLGYVNSDNPTDSRRSALQRSIKVRKFLIENDVNPTNISVNAVEDLEGRNNKIEILVEGHHAKDASIRPNAQY